MLFFHLNFLIFFLLVFSLYILIDRKKQNILLLIASYYFYASWDYRFTSLLLLSTIIDFICGHKIFINKRSNNNKLSKHWLFLSIFVNLSILCTFKYFNFFSESFAYLLSVLGFSNNPIIINIILPVGISFYTFQSMSYTIDVYRGATAQCYPEITGQSFWEKTTEIIPYFSDFALYVSFFPQLVAGPIERSNRLLSQIYADRSVTIKKIEEGIGLFLLGLVMKCAIADEISKIVDVTFSDITRKSLLQIYLGSVSFSIQIYCDFAGYSYMARGIARILGFDLMRNFKQPYVSQSFREFWQRWHISLSTWFRDYLYIPLGGNRSGSVRTAINLFLTMTIAGFWHGSTYAFIAWGAFHGLLLIIERFFITPSTTRMKNKSRLISNKLFPIFYPIVVINCIIFGWFLFRVGDLGSFFDIINQIMNHTLPTSTFNQLPSTLSQLSPFILFLLLYTLIELPNRSLAQIKDYKWHNYSLRFCYYFLLMLMLFSAGGKADAPFIYFQF